MSQRRQPGRAAGPQSGGVPRAFYIVLGVVALVGIAILGTVALRSGQSAATPATPAASANLPALDVPIGQTPEGVWYKGKPDAPVAVAEYADFQCPGCGYFATQLEQRLIADYVQTGQARFEYHDYPLTIHPNAVPAAEAARCAGDQGAFWPMHDLLFAAQNQWANLSQPLQQFGVYAEQLKLDRAEFEQCVTSGKQRDFVLNAKQAGDQLGLPGTPSFAVNGVLIDTQGVQTVDEIADRLKLAIDAALAAKK
jgi:protein-disulfide isomerase